MSKKTGKGCSIHVLAKEYIINCEESEKEMLLKSADYLNQRIQETRKSGSVSGGEKIMVLTALNIAYDFLKMNHSSVDQQDYLDKVLNLNKKVESALQQHQQIGLN